MSTLSVINATIFDGLSADLVDGTVHLVDGRIAEVGPDASQKADVVLDAGGSTVIPGLIDAHFHAYGTSLNQLESSGSPLSYIAIRGMRRLGSALERGFTTVRDPAGGDAGIGRAIDEKLLPAPRYLWMGAGLSQTGGHGDGRRADQELCGCHNHVVEIVDGVEPLRVAVRDRFRRGAHAIKIMASGGVISPTDPIRVPQYSGEEIRAVCEEALRRGSYVAAHAYSPEAIRHAVDNGVRSIEHGNLLDAPTAARLAELGAALVPTLVTYDAMNRRGAEFGMNTVARHKNREVLEAGFQAVELAREAGVLVGFGTDLMGELEDEQLHGLRLQSSVDGVYQALRAATSDNAAILGRSDLGRLTPGAAGDLVILSGNPFDHPNVLSAPKRVVVQAGRVVADIPVRVA